MPVETDHVALRMRGIEKRFGAVHGLRGVDFEVRAGEVHALVGENGAGKSTLMKVLSGAHAPDEGSMFLDGPPYRPANPQPPRPPGPPRQPPSRTPRRRGDDLPGTVPRTAPDGRGEHRAGHGADAAGVH